MSSDLSHYSTRVPAQNAVVAPFKRWRAGSFEFSLEVDAPVLVMGIVNVTPDSFSDGGQHFDEKRAIAHAESLAADGAHILDVGGESTRPGAPAVDVDTEIARVVPVVAALAARGYCVSVDTKKTEVMRAATAAGASIVNDVYALRASGALAACAESRVGVVLMHMKGEPGTMQQAPHYNDVVVEVRDFLFERAQACEAAGVARECIAIDPGFGFGKTVAHNIAVTRGLSALLAHGYPVLAGWSRKSTLGALTGRTVASDRVSASVAAALACVARGARIVRVHDVRETVDALTVWQAMADSAGSS
jgi:dihydropteroate synthase